jgi:hypothetical protein
VRRHGTKGPGIRALAETARRKRGDRILTSCLNGTRRLLLLLASLVALGACSGGARTPTTPSGTLPGVVVSPARTPVSLSLCCGNNQLAPDTQRQIEARATYADLSVVDVTAAVTSWASSSARSARPGTFTSCSRSAVPRR